MTAEEARQVWAQVEATWPEAPTIEDSIVFGHLSDLPIIDAEAAVQLIADAGQGCPSLHGVRQVAGRLRRERELSGAAERRRSHLDDLRAQLAALRSKS